MFNTVPAHAPRGDHRYNIIAAEIIVNIAIDLLIVLHSRNIHIFRRFKCISIYTVCSIFQPGCQDPSYSPATALSHYPVFYVPADTQALDPRQYTLRGSGIGCMFRSNFRTVYQEILSPSDLLCHLIRRMALDHNSHQRKCFVARTTDGLYPPCIITAVRVFLIEAAKAGFFKTKLSEIRSSFSVFIVFHSGCYKLHGHKSQRIIAHFWIFQEPFIRKIKTVRQRGPGCESGKVFHRAKLFRIILKCPICSDS